jgi:hypothetical protein
MSRSPPRTSSRLSACSTAMRSPSSSSPSTGRARTGRVAFTVRGSAPSSSLGCSACPSLVSRRTQQPEPWTGSPATSATPPIASMAVRLANLRPTARPRTQLPRHRLAGTNPQRLEDRRPSRRRRLPLAFAPPAQVWRHGRCRTRCARADRPGRGDTGRPVESSPSVEPRTRDAHLRSLRCHATTQHARDRRRRDRDELARLRLPPR